MVELESKQECDFIIKLRGVSKGMLDSSLFCWFLCEESPSAAVWLVIVRAGLEHTSLEKQSPSYFMLQKPGSIRLFGLLAARITYLGSGYSTPPTETSFTSPQEKIHSLRNGKLTIMNCFQINEMRSWTVFYMQWFPGFQLYPIVTFSVLLLRRSQREGNVGDGTGSPWISSFLFAK